MGFIKNVYDWLGRQISTSEINVTMVELEAQAYYGTLALFIAKSYIANTLSKCEFRTYEGGKEVHKELYYALNVSPNPNQNSSQFINKLVETYYSPHGAALVVPMSNNRLYCADGFSVEYHPLGNDVFKGIVINTEQLRRAYKANEVFYFKLDNMEVASLLARLHRIYGDMMSAASDAFVQSNGQKYKLELDGYQAGDTKFNEIYKAVIEKQLQAFVKSPNAVYPQFKGTNLSRLETKAGGASAKDIVDIRKDCFEVTAEAMKIPLPMLTGNITSVKDIANVYLSYCIDPLADMLEEELTRKTNTYATWKNGNYIKVDTSAVSHIDVLEAADNISKIISSGVLNVDEMRSRLDLNELGTEFSQAYWMTKNNTEATEALKGGETE